MATCCCGCSLALSVTILSVLEIISGGGVLCGVVALIAVSYRSARLSEIIAVLHIVFFVVTSVFIGVTFIILLVVALAVEDHKLFWMAIVLVFCSIFSISLVIQWFMISLFRSLSKVFSVGGTGWEGKSYKEIQAEIQMDNFSVPVAPAV